MFGALRCNKDAHNDLEYVDLSGHNSVNAFKHTGLVSELFLPTAILIRKRKEVAKATDTRLVISAENKRANGQKRKCNGDQFGCQRCQSCTYRSSSGSIDASNSKRRQPASESTSSPKPPANPAKKQQTRSNTDSGPTGRDVTSIQEDQSQPMSSMDLKDGFWTSGLALTELLRDSNDIPSEEPQDLERNLSDSVNAIPSVFPMSETQATPLYSATTAMSIMNDDNLNTFIMTPPSTAHPTGTPPESSEYPSRGCGCIRSLADILQKIGGDGSSDTDEADRFDILLVHLRDGVETCKQVLPCKQCSIHTTNSMFIVTIAQQLATISQDLCHQLLTYQQKVKNTTSAVDAPPLLQNADIYVGRYQVRPAALRLGFLFPIVRLYLQDLKQLLELLRNRIKKGTKAFKMLSAAAEVVQTASGDWQMALNGQKIDNRSATF